MIKDYYSIRQKLVERDGMRCSLCGREMDDLDIDHVLPNSLVNDDSLDNLQLVCRICNVRKSNMLITEREFQDFLIKLIMKATISVTLRLNQKCSPKM